MMKPATVALNQAVLHQVLHEIHQGNYNACKAMGIPDDLISRIQGLTPAKMSRFIYSRVCWCRIEIETPVVDRLLDDLDESRDELIINRAIRLGATSSMMLKCFGLTHGETAQRRRVLGTATRKGRLPELSDQEKQAVWHRWQTLIKDNERPGYPLSQTDQLDAMMLIAEEQSINLASVWQEISTYAGVDHVC